MDTSSYMLGFLRPDGRRWNDLRRIHARVSTHSAADGSSYLEMGNTKVICILTGPIEGRRTGAAGPAGGAGVGIAGQAADADEQADVKVDVVFAAFATMDRKRRGRMDKRITELNQAVAHAFSSTILAHLFPRSTITLSLHVLSQDGSVLAALINAASLALVDAGVPMHDYVVACSAGSISAGPRSRPINPDNTELASGAEDDDGSDDPLIDLSLAEESDLAGITVATRAGSADQVSMLVADSRFHVDRLDEMMAVAIDGCARIRAVLDGVVRSHGDAVLRT